MKTRGFRNLSIVVNLSLINGIFGFVIIKQQSSPKILVLSSSKGDGDKSNEPNRVADEILREEWAAELAANGGDPYFLPDGFDDEDEWYGDNTSGADDGGAEIESPSLSLLSMASMPSVVGDIVAGKEGDSGDKVEASEVNDTEFEWDGVENEDAYYDDF
mmetsp:Transcript_15106/g.22836  ORF Transcript_15106/g.22836 Transcript_15106/m.22836 type:complete len:160 (-) Transcript_15106:1443-1922(-)